jgi:hypothetical protein
MYAATTGYPGPPVSRVPATPALTGAHPRAGPLPPQCGRDTCHPLPAAMGAILPNGFQEPGSA